MMNYYREYHDFFQIVLMLIVFKQHIDSQPTIEFLIFNTPRFYATLFIFRNLR